VTLGQMEIGAEMGVGQEGFAAFAMARLRSGNYLFHAMTTSRSGAVRASSCRPR
jgi:hypothetical protein